MGFKAIPIPPECTPCFALRVCQSCESCEALFYRETPQEVFFLKLVDHRKAGRFLPHLPLACLQDSDWTCQNHLHKQLEENKHGMYLHSQQGAPANYGPCTGNRVAQWKQQLKYKQGNLQFEVVICTKDSMQHIWTYTIGGEQTTALKVRSGGISLYYVYIYRYEWSVGCWWNSAEKMREHMGHFWLPEPQFQWTGGKNTCA